MSEIISRLVEGAEVSPEVEAKVRAAAGLPPGQKLQFMVFEVTHPWGKHYACLSGGVLQDGEPKLTPVGYAAFEALMSLATGNEPAVYFKEIKLGPTPMQRKVELTLQEAPPGALICFFGDMAGELDGSGLFQAFNLKGKVTVGAARPLPPANPFGVTQVGKSFLIHTASKTRH